MSDSREGSPDWLRLFQPPSIDVTSLSSGSDSPPVNNSKRFAHAKQEPQRRKNKPDSIKIEIGEESLLIKTEEPTDAKHENNQILSQDALSPNKKEPIEESTQEKPAGSSALVECDGDSIDLSGDVGAVGRIVISNGPTGNNELLLDLKGTVYKTTIVPSRTFCVVSIGQSEAKIEAIMDDFIQLEPKSNVFEAETMVEGTLDGFSFDSEEETDKVTKNPVQQSGQTNEDGDHTDKTKDSVRKKARMIATPAKKGSKKPQVLKRTRKSKK